MSYSFIFNCTVCGREKKAVNRWWLLIPIAKGVSMAGFPVGQSFVLVPWNEGAARNESVKHLCGEACAVKELGRYMEINGSKPVEVSAPSS